MQKERRQFSIEIGKCDGFVKLSSQAQALYFQLCLSADDEGFTSQIEICMFMAHAQESNLEELTKRRFVYVFNNEDSRVAVIKHWWTNNYIREDKIVQSTFAERAKVFIKDTGVYTLDSNNGTALPQRKNKQGTAKGRSGGSQGSDPRCPSRDGPVHRPLHTGDNPIQSNPIQSNTKQSNPIKPIENNSSNESLIEDDDIPI